MDNSLATGPFELISVAIAPLSNANSRKLFITEQRMNAYETIMESYYDVKTSGFDFIIAAVGQALDEESGVDPNNEQLKNTIKMARPYHDFHILIGMVPIRYGHLFEYNFQSSQFQDLRTSTNNVRYLLNELIDSLVGDENTGPESDDLVEATNTMHLHAELFLEFLQREVI